MSWLRRWDLWLLLACVGLFLGWPRLDLIAAGAWYVPGQGFIQRDSWWVQLS